ncbi:hypothetical protein DEJ50_17115 [Streptomyces venezuelae]|uniref:Calcium-binding protein n=1 Tax=Streptomyces venezuelae TaxID=54571 RepID=A0A5P2D291_STRVZ|nr:hypothetical protein [Streptomyces venezuelae]QES49272.1 hypothetical protein DEJ50_17115 [Streptomyces venezuelae]
MRRPVTATLAIAVAALTLFAAPTAARADRAIPPRILSGTIHPSVVPVGPEGSRTFSASFVAEDDSGIRPDGAEAILDGPGPTDLTSDRPPSGTSICTPTSPTRATCRFTFTVNSGRLTNADAGTFRLWALVTSNDFDPHTGSGGLVTAGDLDSVRIQRLSQLTIDVFPKRPRPGYPHGVVGRLTLADWDNGGYIGAPAGLGVRLEYIPYGGSTWQPVADLTTGRGGVVLTSTPPRAPGEWTLVHEGTETTSFGSAPAFDVP